MAVLARARRLVADYAPPVLRGLACFIGGFTLLNLAGGVVSPGFDCNIWWVDFRPLPAWASYAILAASAAFLLAYGVCPRCGSWWRRATIASVGVVAAVTLVNAVTFYILLARRDVRPAVPVPLSALLCAVLLWFVWRAWKPPPQAAPLGRGGRVVLAGTVAACAIAFPLAQMWFFGKTDYRRPADAIVVFGARAYADGRPSLALSDRVTTACRLYHEGRAGRLIFSGGPGDGETDEPQAMRRLALSLGVPDSAIVLDPAGLSTDATVRNTGPMFRQLGARRVLAVSHAYHLPRVKMAYRRQGWDVYTVPAEETRPLAAMPYLVAREVAAVWVYYLRPLAG